MQVEARVWDTGTQTKQIVRASRRLVVEVLARANSEDKTPPGGCSVGIRVQRVGYHELPTQLLRACTP